jgi:hypothetical protein
VAGNNLITWDSLPGRRLSRRIATVRIRRHCNCAICNGPPKARYDFARFLDDDLRALNDILDTVIGELQSAAAMVVDIRINGGGFDKAGIAIANGFADRRRVAFRNACDVATDLAPSRSFMSNLPATQFTRPVSADGRERTASAGEIWRCA